VSESRVESWQSFRQIVDYLGFEPRRMVKDFESLTTIKKNPCHGGVSPAKVDSFGEPAGFSLWAA
jgi:hypothetical protein